MSKIGTVLLSTLIVSVVVCSLMPAAVHAEAPAISNVQAAVTENTAVISWLTNISATGNVEYGTDEGGPYPNIAPSPADTTADNTMHAVVLFGLGANTTYYYRVKSHDGNPANETTSTEYSFTTKAFTISGVTADSITTSSATITWNTTLGGAPLNATSNVEYGTDEGGPYPNIAPSPADTTADSSSHVVALSDLLPNTTYHYRVKSKDASDNEEVSADHEFTTLADTTPPVILDVDAAEADITDTTAIVRWNTDELATSQVAYSTTSHPGAYASIAEVLAAYESSSVEDTTPVTPHAVPLTGLDPDTPYFYRVLSKDVYVNKAWSDEYQFETDADETSPVISNVDAAEADITETTGIVRWNTDELATSQVAYSTTSHPGAYASIAEVLAAYESSSVEDTTPVMVHAVSLSGLDPGTEYFYRVLSKDVYVNEAWSGEYSFTTDLDITPPAISNVDAAEADITDTTAIVRWNTDELATSQVAYSTTSHPGDYASIAEVLAAYESSSVEDTTPAMAHAVSLSGLDPDTPYFYRVLSKDAYGNEAWSDEYSFTTDLDITPPVISNIASSVTTATATITWNTDELATANVEYGLDDTYGLSAPVPADATADNTSHTVVLSGLLPNTTYHYLVKSSDAYGNPAESEDKTFTTEADTDPPLAPELYSPPLDPRPYAETPIFDWSDVDDPSGVTYSLQVDDNHLFSSPEIYETGLEDSSCTSPPALPDDTYYWRVRAVDGAGNKSGWTSVRQFTIDSTGPEVTVISPNGGEFWVGGSTQDIRWTATDPHMAPNPITIEYYDGSAWVQIAAGEDNDGTYEWEVPDLDISTAKVRMTALDTLGNTDSDQSDDNFTIDSTPPEVEIDQLEFHPATPFVTPTFTGTATDSVSPIDSVEYRVLTPDKIVEIDWAPAEPVDGAFDSPTEAYTFTTSALAEGWHRLEVRATDRVGHTTTISYYPPGFYVTSKPLVNLDEDEPITAIPPMWVTDDNRTRDTTPTFKGGAFSDAIEIATVQCRIGGRAWADAVFTPDPTDPTTGTWEFTPAPLTDGSYMIQVRAIDEAGNETDPEMYAAGGAGYLTFTIDTTPPVISNVTFSRPSPDSVVISWTTDEPATSQVEYGETTEYGSLSEEITTLSTEHSVTITGLDSETDYHFRVKSTDDVGNKAVSDDYSFAPDITPPVISNVTVSHLSPDSVVISWTTDEPATSQVEYGETTEYGSVSEESTTLTTEHSVTITGLDSGTGYHFRVKSTDAAGNEAVSDDYTFDTTEVAIGWAFILLIVIGVVAVGLVVFFVVRRVFAQADKRA